MNSEHSTGTGPSAVGTGPAQGDPAAQAKRRNAKVYDRPSITPTQWKTWIITLIAVIISIVVTILLL